MSDYIFPTKAAEEAAITRYAAKAARLIRQDYRMARIDVNALPATEVYDDCRDAAYDVLLADAGTADLVDLLLGDVTEAAVALVMG